MATRDDNLGCQVRLGSGFRVWGVQGLGSSGFRVAKLKALILFRILAAGFGRFSFQHRLSTEAVPLL